MILQIITWAQIWAAILAQGYRLQPMSCYIENDAPMICTMPLHSSGDFRYGWLFVEVNNGRILIEEMTSCGGGECG